MLPMFWPVPATTPTQRLAELHLGQDLAMWVQFRRDIGMSWRAIAADLAVTTKRRVVVNRETLRGWYHDCDEAET